MDLLLSNPYKYLDVFLLVFVRTASMFISVPIFSNKNIPTIAKIGLAFFITTIVINVIDVTTPIASTDPIGFGIVLIKEFFVGWLIGMGAYMVFTILTLAGQFIDYQVGFSMVNVFDPLSQIQLTITGTFYYYMVLLMILLTNTYHFFIKAMIKSFELIPIGQMVLSSSLYDSFVGFMNELLLISMQIAAPFFFVMLLTDVVLGILARTAPQMNLFVIGFPIKIFLGLGVMLITLNIFPAVRDIITDKLVIFIDNLIKGMMPL
ncbi:MAG: flagellar type III secretion system protein FliR [Firmicutes bacterium HGW-Firmicutes-1]|jgi:flagellar biosynthetic protein FliR|nr:MAG: flagellar type III secretion system protein FliR [Firmicutes bacterium HGW-Firmicutes-1]